MTNRPGCMLTTKDLAILEVMLERLGDGSGPFVRLLRRKIVDAALYFRDEIPARVVTLNSRIVYRVDGGAPRTVFVVLHEPASPQSAALSIQTIHGLALLGLAEGQSLTIEHDDDVAETVTVLQVAFQPEAEMRSRNRDPFRPCAIWG